MFARGSCLRWVRSRSSHGPTAGVLELAGEAGISSFKQERMCRPVARASWLRGGRAAASWPEDGEREVGARARRVAVGVRVSSVEPRTVAGSEGEGFAADVKLERAGRDGEKLDASRVVRLAFMRLAWSERP